MMRSVYEFIKSMYSLTAVCGRKLRSQPKNLIREIIKITFQNSRDLIKQRCCIDVGVYYTNYLKYRKLLSIKPTYVGSFGVIHSIKNDATWGKVYRMFFLKMCAPSFLYTKA